MTGPQSTDSPQVRMPQLHRSWDVARHQLKQWVERNVMTVQRDAPKRTAVPYSNADLLDGKHRGEMGQATGGTITGDITLSLGDEVAIVDATSGAITITLPKVATAAGRRFYIKKIDGTGNSVTIDGDGSETIDDSTTMILGGQYNSATVFSDGTEWWIL